MIYNYNLLSTFILNGGVVITVTNPIIFSFNSKTESIIYVIFDITNLKTYIFLFLGRSDVEII